MTMSASEIEFLEKVSQGSEGRKWARDDIVWADEDYRLFRELKDSGHVEGQYYAGGLLVRLTAKGRDAMAENTRSARFGCWWAARGTNAVDAAISHIVVLLIGIAVGHFGPALLEAVQDILAQSTEYR